MRILVTLPLALSLSACATIGPLDAKQTVNAICASEPAVYAAYVTVATARGASKKKLATAAAAHAVISDTCINRPADAVSAAARIATAYATIVAARAEASRGK
jgi:hypothetical protein